MNFQGGYPPPYKCLQGVFPLGKIISLKFNSQFRRLYSRGKSAATGRMVLYCRKNNTDSNRLGITVSTKLGKAVCRNRIKRRFREIYRSNSDRLLPGYDIIMVARTKTADAEYRELETDYLYLVKKLGIEKQEL